MRSKNKHMDMIKLIGNTPVIDILGKHYPQCSIKLKLEFCNPGGSIKDRVALNIIHDAEDRGLLSPGDELVEATSGNTGIGLAWIGHLKGYRTTIVTHDRTSQEKIALLKYYGANVIIMPSNAPADSDKHYVNVAKRYAEDKKAFFCDQFNNHANTMAHYMTTAPELWKQGGRDADTIVCGIGSGGTLVGIKRYFEEQGSKAKFVIADPQGSILASYYNKGPYTPAPWQIEGIGSNFIPGLLSSSTIDHLYTISDREAFDTCDHIRKSDMVDMGLSSGANVAAALRVISDGIGKRIMCLCPDAGERYISKLQNRNH